jgi:hypothetical protein
MCVCVCVCARARVCVCVCARVRVGLNHIINTIAITTEHTSRSAPPCDNQ